MVLQPDDVIPPLDLVVRHRDLCRRGAKRFLRRGLERADLEQVAAIGLIKASRRYDRCRATPFEAYAWFAILGELAHHVRAHEHLVRLPRALRALERQYASSWERFSADFHREPSDLELALELDIDCATVAKLRRLHQASEPLSLDDPLLQVQANDCLTIDDRLTIEEGLRRLPSLQRRVVVGIYWVGLSRLELGRLLGVTVPEVARAHRAALSVLRRRLADAA